MKADRVAISGASGFVGRNLRRHLADAKISVLCLGRRPFEGIKGEKTVVTDYTDIRNHIKGYDAFIHLAGIGKADISSDYSKINTALTAHLVEQCKTAGIKKFIFNSGLGASPDSTSDYFLSKYKAELAIIHSGLDYTIFRPSYIMGKDDYLTQSLKRQVGEGRLLVPGSGRFLMQPIYVDDACHIIMQALGPEYANLTVDLVGPHIITYQELVSSIKNTSIERTSMEDAYCSAMHDPDYTFGVDDLNILAGSFTGDFERLKKLSGLEFSGYEKALESSGLA